MFWKSKSKSFFTAQNFRLSKKRANVFQNQFWKSYTWTMVILKYFAKMKCAGGKKKKVQHITKILEMVLVPLKHKNCHKTMSVFFISLFYFLHIYIKSLYHFYGCIISLLWMYHFNIWCYVKEIAVFFWALCWLHESAVKANTSMYSVLNILALSPADCQLTSQRLTPSVWCCNKTFLECHCALFCKQISAPFSLVFQP